MNANELLPKLRASFEVCVIDSEHNVVRCEHHVGKLIRSVYFFCPVAVLPSADELELLQEQVVAPSYYRASDASRWNHFLVFVTTGSAVLDYDVARVDRGRIESDKSYARKIVVQDHDLGTFLDRKETDAKPATHANELQQIWASELAQAGLASIATDDARASVVRAVRAGRPTAIDHPNQVPDAPASVEPPVTLRRLIIRRFGDRSLRGDFRLGMVNLVRGPNGVGKTSFLEAIEYFFCGTTFRNRGVSENLDASITFSNGKTPSYVPRTASYYQEKDLAWYGRSTNRGNKLSEGFARYHFINTDAASELSRDPALRDIKEALAKIALGPDASFIWNRILEFERDFSRELNPLPSQWNAVVDRLRQDEKRLQALRTPSPQVIVQISALSQRLDQLGWPRESFPGSSMELKDFATFQPLQSLIDRKVSDPPKNVDGLVEAVNRYANEATIAESLGRAQQDTNAELLRLRLDVQANEERSRRYTRLRQFADRSYGELLRQHRDSDRQIASLSVFQMSEGDIGLLADALQRRGAMELLLGDIADAAESALSELRQSVQMLAQRKAHEDTLISQRDSLIGELRVLARHYTEQNPHLDSCPVCNSAMSANDLLNRLQLTSRGLGESTLEDIALEIARGHQRLAEQHEYLRLLVQLMGLDPDCRHWSCEHAVAAALKHKRAQRRAATDQAALARELHLLEVDGFSSEEYDSLLVACLPDQLSPANDSSAIIAALEAEMARVGDSLRTMGLRMQELQNVDLQHGQEIASLGRRYGIEADSGAILTAAQALAASYTAFYESLIALPSAVIATYADDVPTLLALSATIIADLGLVSDRIRQEQSRDAEAKALEESVAANKRAADTLKSEMDNLRKALDALISLKANHSLDQGLANFLAENQSAIQYVFSRIHVPNELRLSTLADCRLERVHTQGAADLSQISTGQRAAFTLSIFLTLNLSLRSGPPIMLIDDPVAHIDDLNALAFLDYLADIAEGGTRQIFFATADDRLANLFEKKMAFLGPELQVINLAPGAPANADERPN